MIFKGKQIGFWSFSFSNTVLPRPEYDSTPRHIALNHKPCQNFTHCDISECWRCYCISNKLIFEHPCTTAAVSVSWILPWWSRQAWRQVLTGEVKISATGAILPGINVTLSLSLTKAMSLGPTKIFFEYILIRSAGTLTLGVPVKRSTEHHSQIICLVIFKWFKLGLAMCLHGCALGRFIKSKFWNFDNSTHFLCAKYHDLQKKFCSNIAPSIGTGIIIFCKITM